MSSSSSSTSHGWKHDVFASFRGKDERNGFMSYLFRELKQKEINYFDDKHRENAGTRIEDKIFPAIRDARIALVVFSKNYANSKWCLNELVEILKREKDQKLLVLPIFLIDVSEVKNWATQSEFKEALKKLDGEERDKKRSEWGCALEEASEIGGFVLGNDANRNEAELIENIVERLVKEIHQKRPLSFEEDTIGVDHFADDVISLLNKGGKKGVHMVGICGPEGIGKTMVAGVAFDRIRDKFEPSLFLAKIGEVNETERLEGEKFWNFDDIKGIDACYADFITSIDFEVDNTTSSEPETNYGGNSGQNTFKVKLKNGEYITSFAGYLVNENDGGTLINALTFQTNKRMLGPIGREDGKYFSLPSEAGKVTKFFGRRSDDYLKSIGAQVEPFYPFESVGSFGLESGSKWDHGNQHDNVSSIVVELDSSGAERFIRSIKFKYINTNNRLPQWKTDGVTDGNNSPEASTRERQLVQDEYLTSMSGYMLQSKSQTCRLTSLTFQTNKRTLKPFGVEKGKHFSSPTTGGKIVGFYGWSGEHLNAIGAHFQPISHLYPVKSIGPFGGTSGDDWDDGKFDGVKKIWVMHNPDIHYIEFLYVKSGEQVLSDMHGRCPTNGALAELKESSLDYPREYLTSISGYEQEDGAIIQSLTFYTNRRKLGPFGEEKGKYFWYPSTGSRIIGFYGRCGKKLNAIGVYAEPVPQLYPFKIIGPFGGSGGTPWDDGVHSDVRGFRINFRNAIHSIEIVYDNNGSIVHRSKHGGGDGSPCMELWLDYPKERLVSIKGWKDASGNTPQIRNLKIFTTKATHGPFMPKSRSKQNDWGKLQDALSELEVFNIPSALNDGKIVGRIVGFFGRADSHLISIGARLESY